VRREKSSVYDVEREGEKLCACIDVFKFKFLREVSWQRFQKFGKNAFYLTNFRG
jgi:hypothetical protein